jgi:phosphoribosylaminoimidazolecarboxamide formyltransferase/IMP cyclohydrolase
MISSYLSKFKQELAKNEVELDKNEVELGKNEAELDKNELISDNENSYSVSAIQKRYAAFKEQMKLHNDADKECEIACQVARDNYLQRKKDRIERYKQSDMKVEKAISAINNIINPSKSLTRVYNPVIPFKYGCNPHQLNSQLALINDPHWGNGNSNPIQVLNGAPGFINMLDALNSWQLVSEIGSILPNRVAVASFKHTSPAGVAISSSTSSDTSSQRTFEIARNCDPMCSFGDFIAINTLVDQETAESIRREVSDGIIAPSYTIGALEILSKKKGNNYLILKVDPTYVPKHDIEVREMWGLALTQAPNRAIVGLDVFSGGKNVPTVNKTIPESAKEDMLLANVTLKYAQSNNVVMALNGMVIGVAAGQQSRVDAVKLAGRKATTWWLRTHPKARNLPFKSSVKRQDRVNAVIRYVEGDFTPIEKNSWDQLFDIIPEPLSIKDKEDWIKELKGVSMASDAFFPFRDNIDHASKYGVQYIIQPGGSQADPQIIEACDQYGMVMVMSGVRQFTH